MVKRIRHKIKINIYRCTNCGIPLDEIIGYLIRTENKEYIKLCKEIADRGGIYNAGQTCRLINLLESADSCLTEEEALIKDIIE